MMAKQHQSMNGLHNLPTSRPAEGRAGLYFASLHRPTLLILQDAPTIYQSYKFPLLFPKGGRSSDLFRPNRAYLTPSYLMDPDASGGWRFAQCFGDKGDVEDITEGN